MGRQCEYLGLIPVDTAGALGDPPPHNTHIPGQARVTVRVIHVSRPDISDESRIANVTIHFRYKLHGPKIHFSALIGNKSWSVIVR